MNTPSVLSNTKIHTPEQIAAHKDAVQQYFADKRAAEAIAIADQTKQKAHANRILNSQEYYEISVAADTAKKERELQREVDHLVEKAAKDELHASRPETVTISERGDFTFLRDLQTWLQLGYTIDFDANRYLQPNFYSITLNKGVTGKVRK